MPTLMPEVHVVHPRTAGAAVTAHREHGGSRFIAGGSDLLVNMRHGLVPAAALIDLSGIDEMREIAFTDAGVRIGAGVTVAALARDRVIGVRYKALQQAAESIGAPGHRALGTLGGNLCLDTRCIYYNQSEWWRKANGFCLKKGGDVCHVAPQGQRCHAAFTGDLAPALLVLDADIEVEGWSVRRRIPLKDLYIEDGRAHLALAPGELVVAVLLRAEVAPSRYAKLRVRGAIDYPLAGIAVALSVANGAVMLLRVALTGTNSRPFLLAGTDAMVGRPIDEPLLHDIERLVQKQAQPMRTTITAANYRRLAAAAMARRCVVSLAEANALSPD